MQLRESVKIVFTTLQNSRRGRRNLVHTLRVRHSSSSSSSSSSSQPQISNRRNSSHFEEFPHPEQAAIEEARRQYQAAEQSEIAKWLQRTNDILLSDVGSFRPDDWTEALKILHSWTLAAQGTENAFRLFDRLAEEEQTRIMGEEPILTTAQLRLVVGSWRQLPMGLTARDVLSKLDTYRTQLPQLYPDDVTYNFIISGATQQGEPPEFCEQILRNCMAAHTADPRACSPTTVTYNSVMSAYAKSHAPDAPDHAEALLSEMEQLSEEDASLNVHPDKMSFATVLSAWARSGRKDAVARATTLFQHLKDKVKAGQDHLWPDAVAYNELLQTLVAAKRVEDADAMLREFCDESISWQALAKPDNYSFSIVLTGWAKSQDPNAVGKAEALFQRMLDLYNEIDLKPNTVTLNALITVLANSRQQGAAQKALHYLNMMKDSLDYPPDSTSYNTVVSALANSREYGAPDMAELLLKEMQASDSCHPTRTTYNAVINAWSMSKHRDARSKAMALLKDMKETVGADVITYSTLLKCISSSPSKNKAPLALDMHAQMEAASIEPNIRTMNEVMAACAFSNRPPYDRDVRERAFSIASQMLRRIMAKVKPSSHTFSFFFLAAAKLGKDKDIQVAYEICTRLGMERDPQVLRALQQAAPHLMIV